mmetsp:Transcript_88911/g.238078  ORF Transcript_88911/g.238078 Transcript_88911/m.238078 type:complete len:100 (+) Transcript_88911:81-380(+)
MKAGKVKKFVKRNPAAVIGYFADESSKQYQEYHRVLWNIAFSGTNTSAAAGTVTGVKDEHVTVFRDGAPVENVSAMDFEALRALVQEVFPKEVALKEDL